MRSAVAAGGGADNVADNVDVGRRLQCAWRMTSFDTESAWAGLFMLQVTRCSLSS